MTTGREVWTTDFNFDRAALGLTFRIDVFDFTAIAPLTSGPVLCGLRWQESRPPFDFDVPRTIQCRWLA